MKKNRQINNIELSANDLTERQDPKGKEPKLIEEQVARLGFKSSEFRDYNY